MESGSLRIVPTDEGKLWDSDWVILLKKENKEIGTASFAGEKILGTVPVTVHLQPEYRNRGYGTQVLKMLVEWVFHFKNVYEVKAVIDRDNDKALHALSKAGFVYRSYDGREETHTVLKPKTTWMGLYLMIGIVFGMVFGILIGNLFLGFGIGMIICLSIGAGMDLKERKYRESVTGQRK